MHTPGPWHANGTQVTARIGPSELVICDLNMAAPSKNTSAPWPDEAHDEYFANRKLIAAAPDLLAALETVLLAHKYDGALTLGTASLSPAIQGLIEREIAKAKGEPA